MWYVSIISDLLFHVLAFALAIEGGLAELQHVLHLRFDQVELMGSVQGVRLQAVVVELVLVAPGQLLRKLDPGLVLHSGQAAWERVEC